VDAINAYVRACGGTPGGDVQAERDCEAAIDDAYPSEAHVLCPHCDKEHVIRIADWA